MKLQENEKIILETKTYWSSQGIFFPYKKGDIVSKLSYSFVKIYLTNKRITAEIILIGKKVLEIQLKDIIYFKPEIKEVIGKLYIVRIGYVEDGKEKEVYLHLPKKDFDLWKDKVKKK